MGLFYLSTYCKESGNHTSGNVAPVWIKPPENGAREYKGIFIFIREYLLGNFFPVEQGDLPGLQKTMKKKTKMRFMVWRKDPDLMMLCHKISGTILKAVGGEEWELLLCDPGLQRLRRLMIGDEEREPLLLSPHTLVTCLGSHPD